MAAFSLLYLLTFIDCCLGFVLSLDGSNICFASTSQVAGFCTSQVVIGCEDCFRNDVL